MVASLRTVSSEYWDRIVEVHKARLTLDLALVLGMLSLTGYGLQTRESIVFLVAAVLPLFLLFMEIRGKTFLAPFLYKALSVELRSDDHEPLALLYLDYGIEDSKYRSLIGSRQRGRE